VAERAGILEDYILAGASAQSAQTQPGNTALHRPGQAARADHREHVQSREDPGRAPESFGGQTIEVAGRIDPEGTPTIPAGPGRIEVWALDSDQPAGIRSASIRRSPERAGNAAPMK
jgi:hypothetical protein